VPQFIFDIQPGYLDNQQLKFEFNFLQALLEPGYQYNEIELSDAELQRWSECLPAAEVRLRQVSAELNFRGSTFLVAPRKKHESIQSSCWPDLRITLTEQVQLIENSSNGIAQARIPIPLNEQQLWAQHKYSIMARDQNLYTQIGPALVGKNSQTRFDELLPVLNSAMRNIPIEGGIKNALQHMWGHVSERTETTGNIDNWSFDKFLEQIQVFAKKKSDKYLLQSTALTELKAYFPANS